MFGSHRKVYDSAKHRAEGTELANYRNKYNRSASNTYNNSNNKNRSSNNKNNLPKWKLDSLAFRAAMREAKLVSVAEKQSKKTGIPLHQILKSQDQSRYNSGNGINNNNNSISGYNRSGYVDCPHCGRSFSETAGSRHIPQCLNIINKPKSLSKGSGHNAAGYIT